MSCNLSWSKARSDLPIQPSAYGAIDTGALTASGGSTVLAVESGSGDYPVIAKG